MPVHALSCSSFELFLSNNSDGCFKMIAETHLCTSMVVEDKAETRVKEKGQHLPAMEWAAVYRNLRFFLRPFGNPSEGRLDFYHRQLSEVVRQK